MAAKAIVAEKLHRAVTTAEEDAKAVAVAMGIDGPDLSSPVRGDAAYQEMVRAERTAAFLAALRDKVAPRPKATPPPRGEPQAPDAAPEGQPPSAAPNAPQNAAEPDAEAAGGGGHGHRKRGHPRKH